MKYGLAVAAVAAAFSATLLWPNLVRSGAFVLLLGVVAIVTWYGGWRPAVVAIILGALMMAWTIPPGGSFQVGTAEDMIRLVLFVLISIIIARLFLAREKAEAAARRSEQRLVLALDAARMGVWDQNLRTGEAWWSPSLEALFGRAPGRFSTTYEVFVGYFQPDDPDFLKRAITRAIAEGTDFEIEHTINLPDGRARTILTRGRVFCDCNRQPERVIAVATDVTNDGNTPSQLGMRATT